MFLSNDLFICKNVFIYVKHIAIFVQITIFREQMSATNRFRYVQMRFYLSHVSLNLWIFMNMQLNFVMLIINFRILNGSEHELQAHKVQKLELQVEIFLFFPLLKIYEDLRYEIKQIRISPIKKMNDLDYKFGAQKSEKNIVEGVKTHNQFLIEEALLKFVPVISLNLHT